MKKIRQLVKVLIRHILTYYSYKYYSKQFRQYMKMLGIKNEKAPGEDEYMKKWHQLSDRVEPYSYRFFRHFMGDNENIVPEDIGHSIIECILNPVRYRDFYSVKALYASYFGKESVPKTIAYRINGSQLYNYNYQPVQDVELERIIDNYNRLILKPSVDSCSGRGVMLFARNDDGIMTYVKDNSVKLTTDFLKRYRDDFVLQEAVEQHPDLSRFCQTSVNTIRLTVYRSVKDETCNVVSSILRIGRNGEFLDNAHAGGNFASIDLKTGRIGDKTYDQYGNSSIVWNSIDFSHSEYYIPKWEDVKRFACDIAYNIRLMRLIAFDITVDMNGIPKLIEFNVVGFSFWLFQYCGQPSLGEYTDEIIEYCGQRKELLSEGPLII